jgi:hypothetical protein
MNVNYIDHNMTKQTVITVFMKREPFDDQETFEAMVDQEHLKRDKCVVCHQCDPRDCKCIEREFDHWILRVLPLVIIGISAVALVVVYLLN